METLAASLANTIIHSSAAFSVISTFGTDIIVASCSKTVKSIIATLKHLSTTKISNIHTKDILNELNEMDLEFFINIVHQLVIEQKEYMQHESVKMALYGVNEMLDNINQELTKIKNDISIHNDKYFSNWRNFNHNTNEIKKYHEKLVYRYGVLVKLLQIYDKK
jgi:hypothetical protein